MHPNASEHVRKPSKTSENVQNRRMNIDSPEYLQNFPEFSERIRMYPNVSERIQMYPNTSQNIQSNTSENVATHPKPSQKLKRENKIEKLEVERCTNRRH